MTTSQAPPWQIHHHHNTTVAGADPATLATRTFMEPRWRVPLINFGRPLFDSKISAKNWEDPTRFRFFKRSYEFGDDWFNRLCLPFLSHSLRIYLSVCLSVYWSVCLSFCLIWGCSGASAADGHHFKNSLAKLKMIYAWSHWIRKYFYLLFIHFRIYWFHELKVEIFFTITYALWDFVQFVIRLWRNLKNVYWIKGK